MRAGPVELLSFDEPTRMIRSAEDQGSISHRDPGCVAGAVTVAGATTLLAATREMLDSAPYLSELAGWVEWLHEPAANHVRQLDSWAKLSWEAVAGFTSELGE